MATHVRERERVKVVLEGIRVLDFTRVFAGPAATQLLGDMGADVIKVEARHGDEARHYGKPPANDSEQPDSAPFKALNRNKRSLAIDLKSPAGREVVRQLASKADIVVHNFRPGVMERLGIGYEQLRAGHPGLIYAEFSAYGDRGPLRDIGANDLALQAHSGLISITGAQGHDPVRCGTAVVDLHGSLALVSGILGALFHRTRTGHGQKIQSSLLLSAAHLMSYFYTEYWEDGTQRAPMGTANHLSVPNQAFPASDGLVVIIASTDDQWGRVRSVLGDPRLGDPRFETVRGRKENREELVSLISQVTQTQSCAQLLEKLGKARVTVSKVNSIGEAADCPQLEALGAKLKLSDSDVYTVAPPVEMELGGATPLRAPPAVGADTRSILLELGFTDTKVDALLADEVIFGP